MAKKKVAFMGDPAFSTTTGNARVLKGLMLGLNKLKLYDLYHLAIGADDIETTTREGVKVLPINHGGFDDNNVLRFLRKFTQYLREYQFDKIIILGDSIYYQQLGIGNLNLNKLCPKTKIIFWETVDSNVRLCMEAGYKHHSPRTEVYKSCHHVVTTAHYGKKVLEKEFVKVSDVIWEFTDLDLFKPVKSDEEKTKLRMKYRIRKDDFVFFMSGRNIRRKNHQLVINSLYPLLMKYPDMRLFCLIPDFEKDDNDNLIDYCRRVMVIKHQRDLVAEERILFCGGKGGESVIRLMEGISDEEVVNFHQLSDVFISGTSNEGFNLNFGESLAVGNPYVGINNTTLPELSNNGEFAYMIDSDITFNVGMGIDISSCNPEKMTEKVEEVYLKFRLTFDKQERMNELRDEMHQLKYLIGDEEGEDETKVLEKRMDDFEKELEQLSKEKEECRKKRLAELQAEKDGLVKYVGDNFSRSRMVSDWVKFFNKIDEKGVSK